jgi:hypothetical protein
MIQLYYARVKQLQLKSSSIWSADFGQIVDCEIHFCSFGLQTLHDELAEVNVSLSISHVDRQRRLEMFDILCLLQLGQAGIEHHDEERHEKMTVLPEDIIRCAAKGNKRLEHLTLLSTHHMHKLRRQHKGGSLPLDPTPLHHVPQKVRKVDVEEVSGFTDHYVVIVTISQPKDE